MNNPLQSKINSLNTNSAKKQQNNSNFNNSFVNDALKTAALIATL